MKKSFKLIICSFVLISTFWVWAQPVTLSIWARDDDRPIVTALVEDWNASHDNQLEPTFIPGGQFVTKFATAAAGGVAPDLVAIDLVYTPAFMEAGQLTDITEMAKALPFFGELSPSHIRLGTWSDGNIYALPFSAEGSVLVYNKDLFRQAGLNPDQPPTNWADVEDAAQKITALGDDTYGYYFSGACAGCNVFAMLPLVWASGGDILSDDYSQPTFTDPEVTAALEFYHRMYAAGDIPEGAKIDDGADFLNAFTSGKIGMIGTGAFSIAVLKTQYPDIDFGLTPLPGQDGGQSSFAGGDNIAIPTGSEHVEEAFEFIQWLLTDQVQLEQYAKNSQLPVRTDLAENKYFAEDPRLTTAAEAMASGQTPYSVVYNALLNDNNGPWLQMLQSAIFDGDVESATETAQGRAEQIMQ